MTPRMARLWRPVFAIAAICVVTAIIAWAVLRPERQSPQTEESAWAALATRGDDLRLWIRFVDMHADEDDSSISDEAIRQRLARIPPGPVAALAKFWYEHVSKEAKPDAQVLALADAPKPPRYANYLLARVALDHESDQWPEAARRLEREGLAYPEDAARDLRAALAVYVDHDAWNEVRRRAHDPRYRRAIDASLRLDLALHDRDWAGILVWLWPAGYVATKPWPIGLAILSAVLWLIITTRLGRIGDPARGRALLYTAAFLLGILSIYPTLLVAVLEEEILHFRVINQLVPDAIYFIFGVGLREEAAKLLLFLPLLPVLLRRGSRIEAMTCGALVGLGFAAEENVGYFSHSVPSVALARFLTANFLHMSLTALIALSVYDGKRGRSTSHDRFNVMFPLVVLIHGAYDFFLSDSEIGNLSLISMLLLILVARQFLRQLLIASSRMEEEGVLRLFVWSLTLLTGVSYIYATTLAGPLLALRLMAVGGLGVAFLIYIFVRELT
jgi:RsiW-degrading membrane proteinase PrsW (M82 family)